MHLKNTLHLSQALGGKYFGGSQLILDGGVGGNLSISFDGELFFSSQTHITAFRCLVVNSWFG